MKIKRKTRNIFTGKEQDREYYVRKKIKCKEIRVPKDACYVRFGKGKYDYSNDAFQTVRGEDMIIDLDVDGKVIGIELLGSPKARKHCQEK